MPPWRTVSPATPGENRTALADLYNRTRPAVYGFALSIVKNAHDAEDILHDACLQVWNAAGGYRRQGKPMAWGGSWRRCPRCGQGVLCHVLGVLGVLQVGEHQTVDCGPVR